MKDNKAVSLLDTPSSPLQGTSPSRGKETTHGFTLIELLVVVLIIGILAAVAAAQYQKVVEKARLSEALTIMDSLQKAILVWRLANDLPQSGALYFTGSKSEGIDMDINGLDCTTEDGTPSKFCYSKHFRYLSYCNSSLCTIQARRTNSKKEDDKSFFLERVVSANNRVGNCHAYDNAGYTICKDLEVKGWYLVDAR